MEKEFTQGSLPRLSNKLMQLTGIESREIGRNMFLVFYRTKGDLTFVSEYRCPIDYDEYIDGEDEMYQQDIQQSLRDKVEPKIDGDLLYELDKISFLGFKCSRIEILPDTNNLPESYMCLVNGAGYAKIKMRNYTDAFSIFNYDKSDIPVYLCKTLLEPYEGYDKKYMVAHYSSEQLERMLQDRLELEQGSERDLLELEQKLLGKYNNDQLLAMLDNYPNDKTLLEIGEVDIDQLFAHLNKKQKYEKAADLRDILKKHNINVKSV